MLKMARLLTLPTPAVTSPPALSLPKQPLRPGTCLIPCKAAGPRLTLITFNGSEARTPPGEKRVSARRGRVGEKAGFFQHPTRPGRFESAGAVLHVFERSNVRHEQRKPACRRLSVRWTG
jgi:hypothetical protein